MRYFNILAVAIVMGACGQNTGQVPDFEKQQMILKENPEWSLIASTNGKNDQMTRNVITGEIVDHRIRNWGIKWFVKSR